MDQKKEEQENQKEENVNPLDRLYRDNVGRIRVALKHGEQYKEGLYTDKTDKVEEIQRYFCKKGHNILENLKKQKEEE